ncbi:DUF1993 domain-containing protein [Pseudorhodoplanes sp.]|uniref:DUF1993 domain-containing protein n=1 Tax=Pseudorhodoplanes sp. TaxID=1934341 RepID=UPI002BC5273A|nr:DUF1993 domain-containing protein [Pseudorhodoplanes sp.]HWV52654.1 DUF1993 domain-containing protein [Pseudorhodoplanes sp.]
MSISIYQASVPVLIQGLDTLSHILRKGEEHARTSSIDPQSLVDARLAPDMLTLAGQVQRASDTSKLSVERLSGLPAPKMEDTEKTFDDLHSRIQKTTAYIKGVTEAQLSGAETRRIELKLRDYNPVFSGTSYLFGFALPNFYFHVTTAYDILRHRGVPLSKRDFLRLQG